MTHTAKSFTFPLTYIRVVNLTDVTNYAYTKQNRLSLTLGYKRVVLNFIYRPRDKGYDFSKQEEGGEYCQYHGYGAACSLVEVDVLTGEHQVSIFFLLVIFLKRHFETFLPLSNLRI